MRGAYARRASEYAELLGSIEATAPADRELIGSWAARVRGPIVDLGCGPGHWTDFLHRAGAEVIGLDPVEEFVVHARRRFPHVTFGLGGAERLDLPDAGLGGILAWYCLIHTDPHHLNPILAELARVLRPGGSLLLGFFAGAQLRPFAHAVATAYFWPVPELTARLEDAGFVVTESHTRTEAGSGPHGGILATRTGDHTLVGRHCRPAAVPGGAEHGLGRRQPTGSPHGPVGEVHLDQPGSAVDGGA